MAEWPRTLCSWSRADDSRAGGEQSAWDCPARLHRVCHLHPRFAHGLLLFPPRFGRRRLGRHRSRRCRIPRHHRGTQLYRRRGRRALNRLQPCHYTRGLLGRFCHLLGPLGVYNATLDAKRAYKGTAHQWVLTMETPLTEPVNDPRPRSVEKLKWRMTAEVEVENVK